MFEPKYKLQMQDQELLLKFKSVFQNAIDGIIVIDEYGKMEEVNAAALRLFGYSSKEVLGKNVSMLMPQPHQSQHDGYIHNYKTSQKPKIIGVGREVEGMKKDGSTFPFRLAVSEVKLKDRVLFTGIIHDLTKERKAQNELNTHLETLELQIDRRTEELQTANKQLEAEIRTKENTSAALMESQKLYIAIAENFPNGSISVLDKDLNFLFIEGQGLRDLGFGTNELIGKNYLDILIEDMREVVAQKLSSVFNGIPATFEMDSHQYMFRVRAVPLENESNEIDRILLVESNITQQKNAEKEIYNSLQKEKQLNEMKSKFVSMASHEFRTPLSTILSSASLINKYSDAGKPERISKHTDRIQNNVRNLTMILNDFLSLEKLENNGLQAAHEEFNLIECIQEVKEDMEMLKKPNQVITLNNNMDSELVSTDRFIVQNVLTNLVSNAIKYSGIEGQITIDVTSENGLLDIRVKDNGIGISKADQEQLFNRFYRASNAGNVQGTGLGLHIVKRYIALLNGELIFESELGKGSVFGISLDLKSE